MAKPLIVGNWKAYVESLKEAKKLFKDIDARLPRGASADIVVCPPTPFLAELAAGYRGRRIAFGAQDVSVDAGAATGAVTPTMLKDAGASYVIVGHAERRAAGDTDEIVARKAAAVRAAGLIPIVCVGESARDPEGAHFAVLEQNVAASLARLAPGDAPRIVIAYDPLWAIGQSAAPDPSVIREAAIFIRKTLAGMWGRERALKVRVIYGGSVDGANADVIMRGAQVQGVLPGRASTDAEAFADIVRGFSQ